mmetsp:Transcript_34228/g.51319  ORF Transcript_34228/g.51319 Transcript_34228/m.51319 type:complete len:147 (-) Transcript_34228:74-514(-)
MPSVTSTMQQFQDSPQDFTRGVPTFRISGRLLEEAGMRKNEHEDAFLFYSDDEVRMRALSGGTRGAAHQSAGTDGVTRKTRISFELHPSVFFEDLFSDDAFGNGDNERVTDEDVVEAMAENPKMEGVASILFGADVQANIKSSRAA